MGGKSRGITLMILVLIVMTAVTVDQYIQARARLPRGALRQEAPAPAPTHAARGVQPEPYHGPDTGTRWAVRIGGVRIPSIPESASPVPPSRDDNESRGPLGATRGTGGPSDDPNRHAVPSGPPPSPRDATSPRDETESRTRSQPFVYTVKPNETLSDIAYELLGDANAWTRIADLNGIVDATKLRAGQKIRIPAR